jgi:hypothetical protein
MERERKTMVVPSTYDVISFSEARQATEIDILPLQTLEKVCLTLE